MNAVARFQGVRHLDAIMIPDRSKSNESGAVPPADDLGLIRGVTPDYAQRLLSKGVLTFVQIGRMTPDELAGHLRFMRGISAKIIAAQDWIGQARELAGLDRRPQTSGTTGSSHGGHPQLANQGFVVDLFLDSTGEVHQTQVLHVKSNEGDAWRGWDERRMLDFMIRAAGVSVPASDLAGAPAAPDNESAGGSVRLQAAEVVGVPTATLPGGAEFKVKLTFELDALPHSSKGLAYEAVVRATRKPDGVKLILAEAAGPLSPSDQAITVVVPRGRLDTGIYSLRADLAVTGAAGPGEGPLRCESSIPAGMLQVV